MNMFQIMNVKKNQKMMNQSIKKLYYKEKNMEQIIKELKEAGYDYGVAIATKAEIKAGAACGQLSLIVEKSLDKGMNY